jgi:palmitoyltransferase
MVSKGETSIESHDNAYLDNRASAEGLVSVLEACADQIYLNPYDLGRRQNIRLFFNIGPSAYPPATLLFPFLIPPHSNGWSFPRRSLPEAVPGEVDQRSPEQAARLAELGEIRGKYVMGDEGLTDDEDGGGGYVD